MARIRTIKPQLFRHEGLQELESSKPTLRPMLVFAGLFTIADRDGRFEWRPKQIKLDVLPFVNFDMSESLETLATAGFITKYEVGEKTYGHIPTWHEHQCPNVKEPASRIPAPYQHHTGTVPECGEREKEKEREVCSTVLSHIDAARRFLIEFRLTGEAILRGVEQAATLRSDIVKVDPETAVEQIVNEYRSYIDSKPEFKKGPQKWLSECNQSTAHSPKVTKWRTVPEEELEAKRKALRDSGVTQ